MMLEMMMLKMMMLETPDLRFLHDVAPGGGVERRRAFPELRRCVHWHRLVVNLLHLGALGLCACTHTHIHNLTHFLIYSLLLTIYL